jgi:hypothetical protein
MNFYNNAKLIYWASPGCGSRSILGALNNTGEFDTYYEDPPDVYTFTHKQGFPPGKEDWKVVCAIRNPYTRVVSSFVREIVEDPGMVFKDYVLSKRYVNDTISFDPCYYNEWSKLKKPDYFVRMENQVEDCLKIPEVKNNLKISVEQFEAEFSYNHYKNESPFCEYDEKDQQNTRKYFDKETADYVYNKEKIIFEIGNYRRDSWK